MRRGERADEAENTSAHPGKGLRQQFEVAGVFGLFPGIGDKFLLESILGGAVFIFVINTEFARPRIQREAEGRELIGGIMAGGVFGRTVIFLQVNRLE